MSKCVWPWLFIPPILNIVVVFCMLQRRNLVTSVLQLRSALSGLPFRVWQCVSVCVCVRECVCACVFLHVPLWAELHTHHRLWLMTPTINQVSVAGRVQQLSAGAMQAIQDSLKSVYTAAGEQKERKKEEKTASCETVKFKYSCKG